MEKEDVCKNNLFLLIVDDSEYARTMTISMLNSIGDYAIAEADNGENALKILRSAKVDVVLLDVIMPGMSGLELLKEIRKNSEIFKIKVILVTAAANSKTILACRAKETRADAIIVKPFSVNTLRDKINFVMKD